MRTKNSWQSPFSRKAISEFRKNFNGQVILLTEHKYETARRVLYMNPETNKYPALVARCADEADVLRCINFARQQGLTWLGIAGMLNEAGFKASRDGNFQAVQVKRIYKRIIDKPNPDFLSF